MMPFLHLLQCFFKSIILPRATPASWSLLWQCLGPRGWPREQGCCWLCLSLPCGGKALHLFRACFSSFPCTRECYLWTFPTAQITSGIGKGCLKASNILQMWYTANNSTSSLSIRTPYTVTKIITILFSDHLPLNGQLSKTDGQMARDLRVTLFWPPWCFITQKKNHLNSLPLTNQDLFS